MVKMRFVRPDGLAVDLEGSAEELIKLLPQVFPIWWVSPPLNGLVTLPAQPPLQPLPPYVITYPER